MSKVLHYILCVFRLLKKYCYIWIRQFFFQLKKIVAFTTVLYRIKNLHVNEQIQESLEKYWPDCGNICTSVDYNYSEPELDLSIIIPMFNIEKYIVQCLQSVLQQTKYSIEIILVDDGSTDDTLNEIAPFLKDSRIRLIHQKNAGQAVARNRAITESRGTYLMFVDGDDVLLDGAIDCLMDTAIFTGSDIAEGDIIRFSNGQKDTFPTKIDKFRVQIKNSTQHPEFVLTCFGYSHSKVFHRKLWQKMRFPEGYIFEDVITKFILRRQANQVAFVNVPVYGYRWNPTSSSHGNNSFKKLDSIWVFPQIVKLCDIAEIPKNKIFYILALNHIGLLNYITVKKHESHIKYLCFMEIQKELESIHTYRPPHIPLMFCLLEHTILYGSEEDWEYVAGIIVKYGFLKKWREVN